MLEEDHGWKNLKCAGHCLQLSVKSGVSISLIERMIAVARKIVGHFRHSITASEALKERQEQMQVAVKRLQQDVATRWNSTLFMLQSLLHSRWPISAVLSDSAKYRYLDMKPEQWELAEKLIEVLLPLQVATTFLSAEFNVSCSCVIPVLFGLIQSLEVSETDGSVIRQFKIKVVSDIKRRWSLDSLDPSNHLVLASALDPRFKQLKFLDLCGDVKTELLQRMENLPTIVTSMDESDCPPAKKPKETALDILLGPEDDPDQETTSFFDELQGYEASKIPSRDTDPLVWWKNNMYNYPNLAKIARSVLSIPATSTPAERIFSKSGLIVNNLRSCLKCDSVDALVFLNKNLPSLS